jgi:hypothetical protein
MNVKDGKWFASNLDGSPHECKGKKETNHIDWM